MSILYTDRMAVVCVCIVGDALYHCVNHSSHELLCMFMRGRAEGREGEREGGREGRKGGREVREGGKGGREGREVARGGRERGEGGRGGREGGEVHRRLGTVDYYSPTYQFMFCDIDH